MSGKILAPFSLRNYSQNRMSQIKRSTKLQSSKINHQLALCAWCICWLALCLSTSTSSAEKTNLFGNSYASKTQDGFFPADFITQETTSSVPSAKKIDLIRSYLGGNIPNKKIAVVIDTAENSYEDIKRLWKLVVTDEHIHQDIILFVYNDTDCRFVPTQKNGNHTFTEVLDGISASKPISNDARWILKCVELAVKMIDPDNSLILFTGRKPRDGIELGENIAKEMMKNRKGFNCIWSSHEPGTIAEIKDYDQIARYTNGHFLQFTQSDQDEILANGVHPDFGYKTENFTKSNDVSLNIGETFPGMETSGYETADLLYDPKILGYPEQAALPSFDNSSRIINAGENFKRKEALEIEDMELSSLTAIESATRVQTTAVEVTAATSLVGTPGRVSRLTFTVTNNYPVTIRHYFQGRSTSFNIVYLEPRNAWIESGQTMSVVADVLVPTTAVSSTIGTVTLIIQSIGSIEKSAYIYVRETGSTISDSAKPAINYSFNNNCAGKLGSETCSNNLWSVDITVQDSDSGVQRVTSSPRGIQATTNFISGTKSSTKFQYVATCCQTSVIITAEDLLGNSNSETIDVTTWYNLSQGEIAAIILGTFLLLFLILIIILAIILCIRRRRKSQELPFTQRYGSRPQPPRAERTSF